MKTRVHAEKTMRVPMAPVRKTSLPVRQCSPQPSQYPQIRQILRSPTLQPKLMVGAPGDVYEQEADRVADQIMRMPESVVQRHSDPLERAKPIQAKALSGQTLATTTPEMESSITTLKGGGRALAESERKFFEPRFGYNFSQVRLHTDTRAAASAVALNAQAYTYGHDIVFGAGRYQPNTAQGRRLLAHELTHVIQGSKRVCRRNQDTRKWRWTNHQGSPINEVRGGVEIPDYTQRFLGLVMPARATLSFNTQSGAGQNTRSPATSDNIAWATASLSARFSRPKSLMRFVALGWKTHSVRLNDMAHWEIDPASGSISPTTALGRINPTAGNVTQDGPLHGAARVTEAREFDINDYRKRLVVKIETHVNVGGTITESLSTGISGQVGAKSGGASAQAGLNVGQSWSISRAGGTHFGPFRTLYTFDAEKQ